MSNRRRCVLPVRPSATTKTQGNAAMAEQEEEAEAAEEELGVDACMVDGGVAAAIVLRARSLATAL